MSVLVWDQTGDRFYETGVKNGVLYPYDSATPEEFDTTKAYAVGDKVAHTSKKYICKTATTAGEWNADNWEELKSNYAPGVAWNGLSAVTESPSGAEETKIYADDIKYLSLRSAEDFGLTVEAYTYPDEWMACDGSASIVPGVVIGQQARSMFGLCYKTVVGNDIDGNDKGYKLHLVYGATASPSERAYQTSNDSPEAITFSWEVTTTPVDITGKKPASSITIDSTKLDAAGLKNLTTLEGYLFGTETSAPYLPLPADIIALFTPAQG